MWVSTCLISNIVHSSQSFTIWKSWITCKINSRIYAIMALREVRGGGGEQMEAMSKKSEAEAEAAMLPGSCHRFSTHCIKHDRSGPRGGPMLTPLHSRSFLLIASRTDDCMYWYYYKHCMLLTACFIYIQVYNTLVCIQPCICALSVVRICCNRKLYTRNFGHPAVIHTLQVVRWFSQEKTGASFALTNVLRHLFPDQSIQPHPGTSLSLYHVCNMSQQSTRGGGSRSHLGRTRAHTIHLPNSRGRAG